MMRSFLSRCAALGAAMVLLMTGCDLPTEAPSFSFSTDLRTPLVFDKTFVFMGPSAEGLDALVDTTDEAFASLFTVNPGDQTLAIVKDLDDFDLGTLDGLDRTLDLDPMRVAVSIGDLAEQRFSTSFSSALGTFVLDPNNPNLPEELSQEIPVLPDAETNLMEVTIPNFLVPPTVDLVSLQNVALSSVRFSEATAGVNAFTLELINGLEQALTSGDTETDPPRITLLQDGVEIGQASFGFVPAGATAKVRVSVAGRVLNREDLVYRLDVGTADGIAPLLYDPGAVRLRSALEPLHYEETTVSNVPPQQSIDASAGSLTLTAEGRSFEGIITQSGMVTLTMRSTLPLPTRITNLSVTTLDAIPGFPAGSVVLQTGGQQIPAGGTVTLPFDLGRVGIAPRVAVDVQVASSGSTQPVTLHAGQGFDVSVEGAVTIDRLSFQPRAERFEIHDLVDVDVDDLAFDTEGDYVAFKAGTLAVDDLTNGLDLTLDQLYLSLPNFRLPPYGPADTLVVRFEGSTDRPAQYLYSKLIRQGAPRSLAIDLTDVRLYPDGSQIQCDVYAVSESSDVPRTLRASDQISATIQARGLAVTGLRATVSPFTLAVTTDANRDGVLDVMDDAEATLSSFDGLGDLAEQGLEGLALSGSELALNITTNLTPDVVLYGALVGTTAGGEPFFLSGRGDYAVATGDSMAATFAMQGAPIPADRLIRFTLKGAPSPDQPATRTVLLNAATSNVDAFVSQLPESIRFVGKVLVQPGGASRVEIREPFALSAALSASIPLHLDGDVAFHKTFDADLSAFDRRSNPDDATALSQADLRLTYTNGLPLGVTARLEVLDAQGVVRTTLPAPEAPAMALAPAITDDHGIATTARDGLVEFTLTGDALTQMGAGTQVRLALSLQTNDGTGARLRANDTLKLSLSGALQFDVRTGQ